MCRRGPPATCWKEGRLKGAETLRLTDARAVGYPEKGEKGALFRHEAKRIMIATLKNILFGLIVCFSFFFLIEVALRVAGIPQMDAASDPYVGFSALHPLFTINNGMAETSESKLSMFNKCSFPVKKPPDTFRVFCFGGSTTQGQPYNHQVAFSRWLEDLLQASDSHRKSEVINAGGISYASYRIVPLIRETLCFEPDLMVVYTGHNEFLERRTYHNLFTQGRLIVTLRSWVETLNLYKLMERVAQPLLRPEGRTQDQTTRGKKFVLANEANEILWDREHGMNLFYRDDQFSKAVVEHFEHSIRTMASLCKDAGVPIVFVEPACNLRDMSPFKSEHSPNMQWSQKKMVENRIAEAAKSIRSHSYSQALSILEKDISTDPLYADLHYWKGKALLGLGRIQEAREAFTRAKDLDVCPIRAIQPLLDALRKLSAERGIPLVEFGEAVQTKTKDGCGIPGNDCFVDQVHPTTEMHFFIAELILNKLIESSIIKVSKSMSPQERNAIFERGMAALGSEYFEDLGDINLSLAHNFNWFGKKREALAFLEKSARNRQPSLQDHMLLVDLCMDTGNFDCARSELKKLMEAFRNDAQVFAYSGAILLDMGMKQNDEATKQEALKHFKRAVKTGKGDPWLKLSLANAYIKMTMFDEAKLLLEELVKGNTIPAAFGDLARLHVEQKRPAEALHVIEEGIRHSREGEELTAVFGMVLAENGKFPQAIAALKRAIAAHPADYTLYYDLASVYARAGDAREACHYLEQAFQKGFSDVELLKTDTRFERIKVSPAFAPFRTLFP